MVEGTNNIGEVSAYNYNGLGHLVSNTWTVKKNAYGYAGVSDLTGICTFEDFIAEYGADATLYVEGLINSINHTAVNSLNHSGGVLIPLTSETTDIDDQPLVIVLDPDVGFDEGEIKFGLPRELVTEYGNANLNQTSVITKDYVIDYTSALANVIMETESGAGSLTYRYVYGLQKISVSVSPVTTGAGNLIQNGRVKLWYHQDRLGSTDFLTNNIDGMATSYVTYDDWGAPTMKAILKLGLRELDLVSSYTGHPYDPVLGIYYAKARMYDAADRRFMAEDLHPSNLAVIQSFNEYLYVINNPINYVDLFGLALKKVDGASITIGSYGVITTVYINEAGALYVDYKEALGAYGVDFGAVLARFLYNSLTESEILDLTVQHQFGGNPASHSFTLYNANGLSLISFEYFKKLMCQTWWDNYWDPQRLGNIGTQKTVTVNGGSAGLAIPVPPGKSELQHFLDIAREQVKDGASRSNPKGKSYVTDAPWCANFVRWCRIQAGIDHSAMPVNVSTGITMNSYIGLNRFRLSYSVQRDARHVVAGTTDSNPNNWYVVNKGKGIDDQRFDTSEPDFARMFNYDRKIGYDLNKTQLDSLLAQYNWSAYDPREGDLIIFRSFTAGSHNHIGIVEAFDGTTVHTIEGNTSSGGNASTVARKQYSIRAMTVMGFCQNGGISPGYVDVG